MELYKATLETVKSIPLYSKYRVNVERTTRHRMKLVEDTENIADLELKIGVGMIEEVILQAKDELQLIPFMIEKQPWNNPDGTQAHPISKIDLID